MPSGEFALIQKYFAALETPSAGVSLGIGDDAAILEVGSGTQLVVAVDTLVAGVHFPESASGEEIARRSLRVNLSDMAAMGAHPRWFTLALTMPAAVPGWLESFSKGLAKDAASFGCSLVGGDTTKGPLTISIQMLGEVPRGEELTRSGAEVGDIIYVTGSLGAASAALDFLNAVKLTQQQKGYLSRYYLPAPRIAEGMRLRGIANAAIDISDGLLADLGHIAEGSSVGARLYPDKIPVHPGLVNELGQSQALHHALTGGDDYELCFTVPLNKHSQLQLLLDCGDIQAKAIGEVVVGEGVECLDKDGQVVALEYFSTQMGYQHF